MTNLEPGFYWVRLGGNPPEVAHLEGEQWWLCGSNQPWPEEVAETCVSRSPGPAALGVTGRTGMTVQPPAWRDSRVASAVAGARCSQFSAATRAFPERGPQSWQRISNSDWETWLPHRRVRVNRP
jgi:hypothetical protein